MLGDAQPGVFAHWHFDWHFDADLKCLRLRLRLRLRLLHLRASWHLHKNWAQGGMRPVH